jgi:hypothetical protein
MVAITSMTVLATAACGTKHRLSSSTMCRAVGGTYANGTCQPASSPRTAQQMCQAHGGIYFAGGDYCEVEGEWKP